MNTAFDVGCGMFFLRAALLLSCFWIVYFFLSPHPRARVMLCRMASVAIVLLPTLNFLPVPSIVNLPAFQRLPVERTLPAPSPVVTTMPETPPQPEHTSDI